MQSPTLAVLLRFLDVLHTDGSSKQTRIQMQSRMSYDMCTDYLKWTMNHGLVNIKHDGEGKCYFITERGRKYFEILKELDR